MKKMISVILAFFLTFMISGVSFGGKILEPPPPPSKPPADVTGAYVKGYFTVAYDKANPPQYTHHNVHAVLQWDRTGVKEGMVKGIEKGKVGSIDLKKLMKTVISPQAVHLFSTTVYKPQSESLCKYTGEFLRETYGYLPNTLHVQKAFGVPECTCYMTELRIINQDFCGDQQHAMIHGEVQILLYIPK